LRAILQRAHGECIATRDRQKMAHLVQEQRVALKSGSQKSPPPARRN
jgi:hypothetical protein